MKKLKNINESVKKLKNENKMKNVNMNIKKEILMLILITIIKNQRIIDFFHLYS